MEFIDVIQLYIGQGLLYGLGSVGLALTFVFLDFPDFTVLASISLGALVAVLVTHEFNTVPNIQIIALVVSILVGCGLGCVTAYISNMFDVPLVVASIATFVASSTPAYWIAPGGNINIGNEVNKLLTASFSWTNFLIFILLIVVICSLVGFMMKTKLGSLILAFEGQDNFIKYRHKYKSFITFFILAVGNGIVALAGGLLGLKLGQAYPDDHFLMFLPFALGGIAAGKSLAIMIGNFLLGMLNSDDYEAERTVQGNLNWRELVLRHLQADQGSLNYIFLSLIGFVSATTILWCMSETLKRDALSSLSPRLQIPTSIQPITYLIVGVLIVLSVHFSGKESDI